MRRLLPLVCFLAVSFCPLPSLAQSAEATLTGVVRDPQQRLVKGAAVRIEIPLTGLRLEQPTDVAGRFVFSNLTPATYRLEVSVPGFAKTSVETVVLNVGDRRNLEIPLRLPDQTQTVTVVEKLLGVTESAALATVVDQTFVANLPMNGRTFQNLIALTPGVSQTPTTARNPGQFSANGQRTASNYLTIDGVSGNFGLPAAPALAGTFDGTLPALTANGGTNSLVSVDAMQEFQVQTSTFAPEYGRTPGAQITIQTRSGTNDLHGSVFNYFRNDVLDANDWFANRDGLPKPPIRQNNFGGVLGGPVTIPGIWNGRNRTFFFVSYEGLRLRQPQFATDAYPTLASRAQATPANRPLVDAYPIPNQGDLGNGFGRFAATYSNPSTLNSTSVRLDHRFRSGITLWGRFLESPSDVGYRGSVQSYDLSLNTFSRNVSDTRSLTIGSTQILGPRAINDFRFNWSTNRGSFISEMDDLGGARPLTAAQLFPSFATPSGGGIGILPQGLRGYAIGAQAANGQAQWNFIDNFTIVSGRHEWKMGYDYRRLLPHIEAPVYQQFGVFVGLRGPVGILTGRTAATIVSAFENMRAVIHNTSAYVQDTWRPNAALSVTFGVRWEVNPALRGRNVPLYTATTSDPLTARLSPAGRDLFPTQWNAFAPRFGVSYRLRNREGYETTLRGGTGLFYDLPLGGLQSLSSNPPYRRTRRLVGTAFPLPESQAAPLPLSLDPPYDDVAAYEESFRLARTLQFNFTIDQGLGKGRTLTTSYVGALGRNLQRRDSFAGTPGSQFRGFSVLRSDAESSFHSFQTQFRQSLRKGFQAMLSYAWAHAIDTASENVTFNPAATAVGGPRANRASADFDVRHNFSGAFTWDLPRPRVDGFWGILARDWGMDSIFRAQTAFPVDIFSRNTINGAVFQFRPDLVAGQPLYVSGPQYPGGRAINRAAFDIPAGQVRNGTAGRNIARGFPLRQVDFTARRSFRFGEQLQLQFRAEFFNIFNAPSFFSPDGFLLNPLFGQSTQMFGRGLGLGGVNGGLNPLYAIGGPRSTQLSLRIQF